MDLLTDIATADGIVDSAEDDGCRVHGLFVKGARWDMQSQCMADSTLRGFHPALPEMRVFSRKAPAYDERVGQMVGALRDATARYYECPAFITADRGATCVLSATLKMAEGARASTWVLASVALLMDEE
jgi:hypothetical protein